MRYYSALGMMCATLIALMIGAFPAFSATRHVVVIYDERTALPGLTAVDASIVSTLTAESTETVQVYSEGMDLSRFGSAAHVALFRDYLRAKYADRKIDVVIAVLAPPLDFLVTNGQSIFPGAAIVFCGIDQREIGARALPSTVTGVLLKRQFAPTLQVALTLHPDTRRVVVVGGTSKFDTDLLEQLKAELRPYENRLEFTYLTTLPLKELLDRLARLPPHTLVLYTTIFRDGAGVAFVPHTVAEQVSAAANAPLYGFLDQYLGRGIVGGSLYSFASQGQEAARLALRILAGTPPSTLPIVTPATTTMMFDWRQLRRWNIDESKLPPGSVIQYREPSVWDLYKKYIVAGVVFCIVEAIFIVILLVGQARLRRANAYRRQAEEEAHELGGRLVNAQEEERMRIASELHDDVSQRVAVLAINAGREEGKLSGPINSAKALELRKGLRSIGDDLARVSEDIHDLSRRLHPASIEHLGLTEALRSECKRFAEAFPIQVHTELEELPKLPLEIALCIFRISQEALRNISRHAQATHAEITLRRSKYGLQLRIKDDGVGFDSAKSNGMAVGIGLASMRQRARLVRGKIDINSLRGRGTEIVAWVPSIDENLLHQGDLGTGRVSWQV